MYFGCKNCCEHILIASGCFCARGCVGSSGRNATNTLPPWDCVGPGRPFGIQLVTNIKELRPLTPVVWDEAIAEAVLCPEFHGGPPKPPSTDPSSWSCGTSSITALTGRWTCPDLTFQFPNEPPPDQGLEFSITGSASRFGRVELSGSWTVTNGIQAAASLSSQVFGYFIPLPPGESLRSYYGVQTIRIRFSTSSAHPSPLPAGFSFGPYVSELHKEVPDAAFSPDRCIPGPACIFKNFSIEPIAIGYGRAVNAECDSAIEELLLGEIIKDGDAFGRADNREQFYTLQDDVAAFESTFEKPYFLLIAYPDPLWSNDLPDSGGEVQYRYKTLFTDPACIAIKEIEFFNSAGRKLRINPPAQ